MKIDTRLTELENALWEEPAPDVDGLKGIISQLIHLVKDVNSKIDVVEKKADAQIEAANEMIEEGED